MDITVNYRQEEYFSEGYGWLTADLPATDTDWLIYILKDSMWWTLCHPDSVDVGYTFEDLLLVGAWTWPELHNALDMSWEHVDFDTCVGTWMYRYPGIPTEWEDYEGLRAISDLQFKAFHDLPWHKAPEITAEILRTGEWYIPAEYDDGRVRLKALLMKLMKEEVNG